VFGSLVACGASVAAAPVIGCFSTKTEMDRGVLPPHSANVSMTPPRSQRDPKAGETAMLHKNSVTQRYIELLKKSVLNELYIENEARIISTIGAILANETLTYDKLYDISSKTSLINGLKNAKTNGSSVSLARRNPDGTKTGVSRNYTELSHTMIGRKRLDNVQLAIETILEENIPGDLIETGIWRGGTVIFMRGILAAYEIADRIVWAADSFEGVPPPTHPQDANFDFSAKVFPFLAVSSEQVSELVARYDLLDGQVKFLKGWFKNTLKTAPIEKLAMLRLDGDLYESTMDALNPLYGKV
jgi:O-methyltransferase